MTYIWILAVLLLLIFIWSFFLEQRRLVISEYKIPLNVDFDINRADNLGLSFVVLADLHNKTIGNNNRRLLKKILEQKPDFVIIAGDLITKGKPSYPGNAYNLIKNLSEHYPIYYAYGNHEQAFEDTIFQTNERTYKEYMALYDSWDNYKEELKQLGVHLLDNKSIILQYKDIELTITGLSIESDFYRRGKDIKLRLNDINNKVGNRNRKGYQILIAHNPIYFKEYVSWGADLVLSGHIHGGLVRIPCIGGVISPQVKFFPKYDAGHFNEMDQHMVVSRGLGTHSSMPRFLNPPELVVIRLGKPKGAL